MSKTLGNVIDPYEVIKKYGLEAFRYFLLSEIPTLDDGDFTISRFEEVYQADLANGLGNLVSRIAGLAGKSKVNGQKSTAKGFSYEVAEAIEAYELNKALELIWQKIRKLDVYINKRQVWNLKGQQKKAALNYLIKNVQQIAYDLQPFLPETAERIRKQFSEAKTKPTISLFPRLK